MISGVLLVSNRYGFVLAALTLSLLTACSQAGETIAVPETSNTPPAQATPQTDDLTGLTLTVADLPTGGWSLKPSTSDTSAETSTDKTAGELCALDFTSVFPTDLPEENGATFTREKLNQQFITGVFNVEDGEQVVADLNTELASCTEPVTSTTNGQESRSQIDALDGGETGIEGETKACRQMKMTFGYTSVYGSFCIVAHGDLVVSTMTTGPYASTVQPDEFVQLTNAATQKAFATSSSAVPTESAPADGLSDGIDIPRGDPADKKSIAAAVTVAEKLMTAFARPDVDETTWINGLYPYLTQAAGTAYAGTNPAKVPASEVTGPGTVVEGHTAVALLVKVPTNIGPYVISLTRQAATDPWLADRITPPAK